MLRVQYRLIDRRKPAMRVFEDAVLPRIREARDNFFKMIVSEIVQLSPVDSGTYMDGHNISEGRQGGATESSHRKPRRQPWAVHAEQAIARLYAQIESLPDSITDVRVHNDAVHARFVEYGGASGGGGYAPYQSALNRYKSGGEM